MRIIHTSRMPQSFYTTRRIRYAVPARAVADAARGMARLGDVRAVVGEAVQNGRCDLASLISELNEGPSTGSRALRIALGEVGDGVRSAAEADLKTLINGSDLERPMYNASLYELTAPSWVSPTPGGSGPESSGRSMRQYSPSPKDYARTTARHNHMTAYGINLLALSCRDGQAGTVDRHRRPSRRNHTRQQRPHRLPIVTVRLPRKRSAGVPSARSEVTLRKCALGTFRGGVAECREGSGGRLRGVRWGGRGRSAE